MSLIVGTMIALTLSARVSSARAAENFISVDGRRVGVVLVPEKPSIMLGEPTALVFTLNNYSDDTLYVEEGGDYRNALGRSDSFKVTVQGAQGTPVPQPKAGESFGGIVTMREIPAKGSYSFRLFLPHWAQFQTPGTCAITARRKLLLTPVKGLMRPQKEMIEVIAQASTSIQVVPLDSDEMGRIINALGAAFLSPGDDRWPDSPAVRLTSIEDERVIPWFARAFASRNYGLKFAALAALAKFDQVEAFNILKAGMDTKGEDMEGATTPELASQLADNIRHGAGVALSRSPYSEAKAFLISRRNDQYMGVRITVLHVLGKMPSEEALPILEEMSRDQDTRVSNEAKRYIGLLTAKK